LDAYLSATSIGLSLKLQCWASTDLLWCLWSWFDVKTDQVDPGRLRHCVLIAQPPLPGRSGDPLTPGGFCCHTSGECCWRQEVQQGSGAAGGTCCIERNVLMCRFSCCSVSAQAAREEAAVAAELPWRAGQLQVIRPAPKGSSSILSVSTRFGRFLCKAESTAANQLPIHHLNPTTTRTFDI
jgi:hypothetical protein